MMKICVNVSAIDCAVVSVKEFKCMANCKTAHKFFTFVFT